MSSAAAPSPVKPGIPTEADDGVAQIGHLLELARSKMDSEPQQALAACRKAVVLAVESRDPDLEGNALCELARSQWVVNDFQGAVTSCTTALQRFEISDNPLGTAFALHTLGTIYGSLAVYQESLDLYLRSLKLRTEHGDLPGEANSLLNIGITYFHLEEHEKAVQASLKAARLYEELGNRRLIAASHNNIGKFLCLLGRFDEAWGHLEGAVTLWSAEGNQRGLSYSLHNMGQVRHGQGRTDEARQHYERSAAIKEQLGERRGVAESLHYLGKLYLDTDQPARAIEYLGRALSLTDEIDARRDSYDIHQTLAEAHRRVGDYPQALAHFKAFHDLKESVFNEIAVHRTQVLQITFEVEQHKRESHLSRQQNEILAQAFEEKSRLLDTIHQQARKLERLAHEDSLTGLLNRRAFNQRLAETWERAKALHRPLVLALLDLDYFKQVNDRYGHVVGDELLRLLAELLVTNCRPTDFVVRYGGEEFAILFPDTTLDEAIAIVQRLRSLAAQHGWIAEYPDLTVTLSAGLAASEPFQSPSEMVHHADQLLYRAKAAGRNCLQV